MQFKRTVARAITMLFIAATLTACGGADARRATHMERGQKYFADGNYEKARVEFRNALQIAPNDPSARFMNGRVAEKLGDLRGAAGLYQGAIDVDSDHVKARSNLGRMLVFGGLPERALDIVGPGLEKHPDDADLLTVRGAARSQLKDNAAALADAERAVKIAPENAESVALLASLYRQADEASLALDLVKGFVARHPDDVDLRQVLASLYLSVDDTDSALAELRKVVELRPQELSYRQQLAMQYVRAKKPAQARDAMREAAEIMPDSDQAKLAYVEFLTSQGEAERGEQVLREFIAKDATNYELQLGLGELQQRNGSVDAALATYRRLMQSDEDGPAGIGARNRIAVIEAERGNHEEAHRLVEATLKQNPRDNDALLLRGNLALARNDASAAVADLRTVLRDQPGSVALLRSLARAHSANGEPALAEETLRQAMDLAATDISVRVELAQLYLQTGRAPQAVSLLEETVRRNPANVPAREALTRAYFASSDFDAAKVAAEDLKIVAPKLATGYYMAGMVAQVQKRLDDAVEQFEHALAVQPDAMDALAAASRLDWALGRHDRATARIEAAIAASPKSGVPRNLLGETQLQGKQFAAAASTFRKATEVNPQWWLPWRNLAVAQLAQGDKAAALSTYEAGVKATGHEPLLVSDLAALYERQGRVDEAIAQYEILHDKNPRLDVVANNLAMLLVNYRKDRESLDQALRLTESFAESDNGALLDTHGWVRFKLGQYTEALPVLERAAKRAPQAQVIRYHLAMAQLKTGQRDEARQNLQQALQGTASFSGADEARTALASLSGAG